MSILWPPNNSYVKRQLLINNPIRSYKIKFSPNIATIPTCTLKSCNYNKLEIGSSSNSVPTFDSNSVEKADNSRRSVHVEQMDTKSPSMTMAMLRNVREDRGKGTISTRIIEAACAIVATVIGGGREMEENVAVEVHSNQNTVVQLEKMDSGIVVIGDGTGTSGDGMGVGARISKEGEESIRIRKVCVSCQFFLAKQMHFCLANRISKFRVKTRNK